MDYKGDPKHENRQQTLYYVLCFDHVHAIHGAVTNANYIDL